jgi:hypothetical protein
MFDLMDPTDILRLYEQREPLGFFDRMDAEGVEWSRTVGAGEGFWYNDGIGRAFAGDGERLAEWGVCRFMQEIEPYLRGQGVGQVACVQDDWVEGKYAYTVNVNGRDFPILVDEDMECNPAWAAASVRTQGLVEELLREAGSPEHAYIVSGTLAESSIIVFLTAEMYHTINNSPLVPEGQKLMSAEETLSIIKLPE